MSIGLAACFLLDENLVSVVKSISVAIGCKHPESFTVVVRHWIHKHSDQHRPHIATRVGIKLNPDPNE